jgi:hypothetical protein
MARTPDNPGNQLKVAQAERELVPLVEAMTLVDEVAGAVVARINAIPARFTRNIEQRALGQSMRLVRLAPTEGTAAGAQ